MRARGALLPAALLLSLIPAGCGREATVAPRVANGEPRFALDEVEHVFGGRVEGAAVRLEVAAEAPADTPLPGLARLLAEAAAEMLPRVPLDPATLAARPVTVAAEPDHVAQIAATGNVGEAVRGGPADLHLVLHADDRFAYRHALAGVLIQRAGVAVRVEPADAGAEAPGAGAAGQEAPPYLAAGAALWLSGEWYGRPWRDWLPRLAAAGVLPTAAELTAAEEPPDGSRLLWTPVAAALVDRLPGATLAEKLASPLRPEAVAGALAVIEREAASRPVEPLVPRRASPRFLAGVSLAMTNSVEGGYHAPVVGEVLARLRGLGADAVSLMPFAFQADPAAPAMRYLHRHPRSETDVGMVHAARAAHAAGFRVLWKPQIWLRGSWPGEIRMTRPADWATWWRAYRRFVVHHALLAEWSGAGLLSVGTELGGTLEHEAEWRRLIAASRRFFSGPATYAANWYGDFDRVPFWDALDVLGVDAYQPLAESPNATPAELRAGAEASLVPLARAAREHGKPVLLTEVGFAAHRAAWVAPHEEGGVYSEADQAAAYRALLTALDRRPWLAGVFVWKAFSDELPGPGGAEIGHPRRPPDRADFRFLGREAEEVVREYFRPIDARIQDRSERESSMSRSTTATVSSKYQIVIPLEVRREADIRPGTEFEFVVDGSQLRLVPVLPLGALRGTVRRDAAVPVREKSDRL
ncbi:MAG TPA: AbrB/MazE/SpoVT family DNA-binding domain-containing protein [Thermoanaerobaculia bacterium]|nr:AbrB/MazE/SpoVT family DNA-binding domain-containing protein [Thermoanaerobaculia bacterium]